MKFYEYWNADLCLNRVLYEKTYSIIQHLDDIGHIDRESYITISTLCDMFLAVNKELFSYNNNIDCNYE